MTACKYYFALLLMMCFVLGCGSGSGSGSQVVIQPVNEEDSATVAAREAAAVEAANAAMAADYQSQMSGK